MKRFKGALAFTTVALLAACGSDSDDTVAADAVYQNGYVYTVDNQQSVAQAVAVKDGAIIYVGTTSGAQEYVGDSTTVVELANKMMLPGLHDVHIHPTGIVDLDMCDLGVQEMNLESLVAVLNQCKATYQYGETDEIFALQWNSYVGNEPSGGYTTLVEALDAISTTQPVFLAGPDGHSAAVNSFALGQVKNEAGEKIGLNKTTLANEFIDYVSFVGVDGQGNPTGYLTEAAMHLVQVPSFLSALAANPQELPKIAEKLNKYGITSAQDAWTGPDELALYKIMANNGDMTFRLTAAQSFDVTQHITEGSVNYETLVADVLATQKSLQDYPFMKSDTVKIMVDGVQEGDIWSDATTLPTSVMVEDYKQPIINISPDWEVTLGGYVDLDGAPCTDVQNNPQSYDDNNEVTDFVSTNGFYPKMCAKTKNEVLAADSSSLLLKDKNIATVNFLNGFVSALDQANITTHMHAVGDGAVRAAIDAIELAKTSNPNSELPHAIAHMQVVHPDDQQRLGELGIYLAYTYAWAVPDYEYDLSVIPFIDELADFNPATLYSEDNYYIQATYPVRSTKDAGAILVAGSDAPVDTREPVPFVHMATGMTRDDLIGEGDAAVPYALNANQTVSVHDMIAAYTINGAKALRQDDVVGSIEVGKRADLIIIDQNIVELAEDTENPFAVYDIFDTQVLTTIFDGKVVYNVATQ